MVDPHTHTGTIRITTLFEKGGLLRGVTFLQRHPAPGGGRRRLCPYWR